MNTIREAICAKCDAVKYIDEIKFLACPQPCYPINDDEWRRLGVKPDDEPTPEKLMLMMEISTRPCCKEKMLAAHPIEWWYEWLQAGG